MNVNERLKALRKESGLTQKQLADNLRIGQTTITSYENNSREPHISSLIAYADFFKCSLDFLIGREGEAVDMFLTAITPEEIELLRTYRDLNGNLKKHLLNYIKLLDDSELNKM